MYSVITTKGFVIDSRPSGEAGKLLFIFTKDYGLVMATAQGIRLEKSKLRYFVQDYSFGEFSFVKGKEYWRLTNAQEILGIGQGNANVDKSTALLARVALLLKKLLHGEEMNSDLFDVVYSLIDLDKVVSESIELLTVLRIFHKLGYIGKLVNNADILLESTQISAEVLKIVDDNKVSIIQHINKAIFSSNLNQYNL